MSLFDSSLPGVTVLVDVPFPSNCLGGPGIEVDKTDPTGWLVSLDYPPLIENDSLQPTSNYYFAVYDQAQNMYERARLDKVVSSATGLDTRTAMGDANYLALTTDRYIGIATPFTLNRTLSLPAASSVPGGREILVQDEIGTLTASHFLTVQPTGTDTISGKATRILATPYGGLRLRSNGTNSWNAIATTGVTPVNDTAYFCNADDKVVLFTALTAARNVTLPAAAAYPPGQRLLVIDQVGLCSATLTLTVLAQGSDTINGLASSPALNSAHAFLGFVADGVSKWTIVDNVGGGGGGGSVTSAQITDASPLGRLLLTQATAALDRTSLGSGNTGDAMFLASTPAAGRAVLGSTTVGDAVFIAANQAAAQSALGLGTMATQNANAVAITGGTITGVAGLGSSVTISDTPPASPSAGSMWWDSVGGNLYLWYNDGTSSQWIIATNQNLANIYLPLAGGHVTGNVAIDGSLTAGGPSSLGAATVTSLTAGGPSSLGAATVTSLNGGPLAGQRNRIINGAMLIDQRGAGAAGFIPVSTNYVIDRWTVTMTQSGKVGVYINQTGLPAGAVSQLVSYTNATFAPAATDTFLVQQTIEANNLADLGWGTASAKPVTLSFLASSQIAGTHSGSIANPAANRSYPFSFSLPVASTWYPISITIPGDTAGTWPQATNALGMYVRFNLGSGANYLAPAGAWTAGNIVGATGSVQIIAGAVNSALQLTNVQLEAGSVATPFERRLYGTELALCQRYYQQYIGAGLYFGGYCVAGVTVVVPFTFPTMRIAPALTIVGTWNASNCPQPTSATTPAPNAASLAITIPATGGYACSNAAVGAGLTLSAEL